MSTVKPFAGETMYAAGKGALNALTRHMANDFGKFSIRVNALRMGWIGGAPFMHSSTPRWLPVPIAMRLSVASRIASHWA